LSKKKLNKKVELSRFLKRFLKTDTFRVFHSTLHDSQGPERERLHMFLYQFEKKKDLNIINAGKHKRILYDIPEINPVKIKDLGIGLNSNAMPFIEYADKDNNNKGLSIKYNIFPKLLDNLIHSDEAVSSIIWPMENLHSDPIGLRSLIRPFKAYEKDTIKSIIWVT